MIDEWGQAVVIYFFVCFFGASIGSFLNVVAWRVPQKMSVVQPGSHCPSCQNPIPAYALIPILGYLLVKARCVKCGIKISPVYPLIEAITGLATLLIFCRYFNSDTFISLIFGNEYGHTPLLGRLPLAEVVPFFGALWMLYTGIPLSLIDMRLRILPNRIVIPGTLVAIILGGLNPRLGWMSSIIGSLSGSVGLFLIAWLYELVRKREGMGMGDVKYLALLGALTGWQGVIWIVAGASFLGTIYGLVFGLIKKEGLATSIPFGPFLFSAGMIVYLYLTEIQALFYGA